MKNNQITLNLDSLAPQQIAKRYGAARTAAGVTLAAGIVTAGYFGISQVVTIIRRNGANKDYGEIETQEARNIRSAIGLSWYNMANDDQLFVIANRIRSNKTDFYKVQKASCASVSKSR